MRTCERCGKKYERTNAEIIVYPNVCHECDVFLSNIGKGNTMGKK